MGEQIDLVNRGNLGNRAATRPAREIGIRQSRNIERLRARREIKRSLRKAEGGIE